MGQTSITASRSIAASAFNRSRRNRRTVVPKLASYQDWLSTNEIDCETNRYES